MARYFDGSSYGTAAGSYLSGASEFTVVLWVRPDSLTPAATGPLLYVDSSGSGRWRIDYTTSGTVTFDTTAHTGSDPATSSATAAFSAIDLSHGKRVLYRYDGNAWVVWTGSRTGGIIKKTINAAIGFVMPTVNQSTLIGTDGANCFVGGLAEVGIYSRALSDADCEQLLRGVACDQIGGPALQAYWPHRGSGLVVGGFEVEPDYIGLPSLSEGVPATQTTTTAEAHPPVYGLDELTDPVAAWCAEIQHADGTIYAATMDLFDPVDFDVLGRAYPQRIENGESVVVARSINDGIVTPGSTTLVMSQSDMALPGDVRGLACWLEADQLRGTYDDGDAVTLWPDISGRGIDASDATGPTYDADGINGLPALLFDAGGEAMSLVSRSPTTGSGSAPYTIITVFTRADAAASTHTIMAAPSGGWILYTDSSNVCKADVGSGTVTLGTVTATNTPQIASFVYGGSDAYGRLNQGAWSVIASASAHPGNAPIIGANSGGSLDLDGRVAAVFIFDRALGLDELTRVENYLAAKYGVAAVPHALITRNREWRNTRVILRRYERRSHELVTELVGLIADVDWSRPGKAAFTLTGASDAVLNERIPKALVNADEHATATDLLAPVPVGFGDFWVSAPYIGRDDSASPGTADFAVSHLEDADGAAMNIGVERVLFDIVPGFPGLEEATSWYEVGGTTPTRVSDTVMQLSADYESFYEAGMPVRVTVSGTEYYTTVASYDGATDRVTVADAVVTTNPSKVELLAGAYLVRKADYQSGGADLCTVRFVGTGFGGGVVVFGRNATLSNPADVIAEILRNDVWGLGETIDGALFDIAAADFSAAGLGSACNYALGGDRQQRSARQVLGELLALRGAWVELQEDGSWALYVDKVPVWEQSRTYTLGSKRFPQMGAKLSHGRTPLGNAVRTLKLRFRRKGRSSTSQNVTSWIAPQDYEFQLGRSVLSFGADRIVTNPWLDRATNAGRVVVYQGKRMAAEDETISARLGFSGRNVALGEVLRFVEPLSQVDGLYRVLSLDRSLHQTTVRTAGYSASIFDYDSADITYDDGAGANTSTTTSDTATGPRRTANGPNLIPNSGFGTTSGSFSPIAGGTGTDTTFLGGTSGWTIAEGGAGVTDIGAASVVDSESWIGGRYLSLQIDSVAGDPNIRTRVTVEPGKGYLASLYMGKSGVSAPKDVRGWYCLVRFYNALGTEQGSGYTPSLRTTGETTGDGTAARWFFGFTPPSGARYAILFVYFSATGTYRVAGTAINSTDRFAFLPPPWQNTALRS